MLKKLIIAVIVLTASNSAMASQFCAVTNYGQTGACFYTYDMCQSYVASSGAFYVACVAK